jgi:hypothetical protein
MTPRLQEMVEVSHRNDHGVYEILIRCKDRGLKLLECQFGDDKLTLYAHENYHKSDTLFLSNPDFLDQLVVYVNTHLGVLCSK